MDFPTVIEKYWGVAVGLFTVFKAWSDQRAKRREAETAAATAKAVAPLAALGATQDALEPDQGHAGPELLNRLLR